MGELSGFSLHAWRKSSEKRTIELLNEVAPAERLVMGVTEDIAGDTMNPYVETGLTTVLKTLKKHGKIPIQPR